MIGSLEVTHELIFTIPSVIQIYSINSIRLKFNLGKPPMIYLDAPPPLKRKLLSMIF